MPRKYKQWREEIRKKEQWLENVEFDGKGRNNGREKFYQDNTKIMGREIRSKCRRWGRKRKLCQEGRKLYIKRKLYQEIAEMRREIRRKCR